MARLAQCQRWCALLGLLAFITITPAFAGQAPVGRFGDAPMQFEPNVGQAPVSASYVAHGEKSLIYLNATSVSVAPANGKGDVAQLRLIGANASSRATAIDQQSGVANYLLGQDPAKWRTNVPTFGKVRYENVYRGTDVVYYGHGKHVEYDFVVSPGGDPAQIRMEISKAEVRVAENGDLVATSAGGELRWTKPIAYQETAQGRKSIEANYTLSVQKTIAFAIGEYDHALPLYIDPEITYATYLGGSYVDEIWGAAADWAGNAYVTGRTESPDFPFTTGVTNFNGKHAFVVKYGPDGKLIYSVYLGGTDGEDVGMGIAVDGAGSAYVVGTTYATNFPTTANAFAPACTLSPSNTCSAAFMAKLKPDGTGLLYSTYISGGFNTEWTTAAFDEGYAVAIGAGGIVYAGGATQSAHFPTTAGAAQTTFGGARDGWVMKFDTTKSGAASLLWSTYLGGSDLDTVYAVAIDAAGNVYAGGDTYGSFPVKNALIATPQGSRDGFVAKLNPSGSSLIYSTYLAGSDTDVVLGLAADNDGYAYATGQTKSPDFPVHNAAQPVIGGGAAWGQTSGDAYVTKITPAGDAFVYSTFLGGLSFDWGQAIAADSNGVAYVTGLTDSAEFPIVSGAPQTWHGGNDHAFLTEVGPDGTLLASTFIGTYAQGNAVAVDSSGNVIVAGVTTGSNFPTKNPAQANSGGGGMDGFVVRVAPTKLGTADLKLTTTTTPDFKNGTITYDITVVNNGPYTASGVAVRDVLPPGAQLYSSSAPLECFGVAPACKIGALAAGDQAKVTFTAMLTNGTNLVNTASVAAYDFDPGLADNSQTTTVSYPTVDLKMSVAASVNPARVGQDFTVTATVTNAGPDAAPSVVVTHTPPANVTITTLPSNCSGTNPIQCTIGTLASGGSATVNIVEKATSANDVLEVFDSRSAAIDADLMSNSASMTVPVHTTADVDLSLTIDASPAPVPLMSKLSVALKVTNVGGVSASQVHLLMTDPSTVNYDSVVSGAWTCSHMRLQVDCTLASLAAGANSAVTIVYVPQFATPVSGSASVSSTETDIVPDNNMALVYVNVSDFNVSTTSNSVSLKAGQSANYTIDVDPKQTSVGFGAAITFACSGLPALSACNFSPASVTPGAARASTTLTITTTAPINALSTQPKGWGSGIMLAMALPLLGIVARSRRRILGMMMVCSLAFIMVMSACGGGGGGGHVNPQPGTPSGTYSVTVTATSGGDSHSTVVTLIVQ